MEAWDHYNNYGMNEGRIWHSELCGEDCGYVKTSYSWVDARSVGVQAPQLKVRRRARRGGCLA